MNERNPESNEVAEKLYLSVLNSVRSSMDFEGFKIDEERLRQLLEKALTGSPLIFKSIE